MVEIPGRRITSVDIAPDKITLPKTGSVEDYVIAPCKHECSLLCQSREAKQAYAIFLSLNHVKRALMRATTGHCGRDLGHYSHAIVESVAAMGCPNAMKHGDASEGTLFAQYPSTVLDFRMTLLNWRGRYSRRFTIVVQLHFGTRGYL